MRISRNAPCPCGSGRKYKHCCIHKDIDKVGAKVDVLSSARRQLREMDVGRKDYTYCSICNSIMVWDYDELPACKECRKEHDVCSFCMKWKKFVRHDLIFDESICQDCYAGMSWKICVRCNKEFSVDDDDTSEICWDCEKGK